jgi:aminoglycoside phosphotransferase (APT) family kinase protein
VYVLDAQRVLRVVNSEDVQYDLRKDEVYGELIAAGLPWMLPRLLDHGDVDGVPFTLEERIPGRSLDHVLAELAGARRERALIEYADGSMKIASTRIERPWFGELLYDPTFRRDSWAEYLVLRAEAHVRRAGPVFERDVPDLAQIMHGWREEVTSVAGVEHSLVHGDYFPGNVMVDDNLEITSVIDFGWSTVIGDARLDLVCASVFLEVERAWCTQADADLVRDYLGAARPDLSAVDGLYRTYCALHFSFVHHYGLPLYRWCVRTLNR